MSNNYIPKPLRNLKRKSRTNWRKELKLERSRVIDEAIDNLRREMRKVPTAWHRGYSSAITHLELMKETR